MNTYYLLTLPDKNTLTRLNDFLSFGKNQGNPHQLLHYKKSIDGTKYIIQGDISSDLLNDIAGKGYITKLGEYTEGKAEQSVYDYLAENKAEWENNVI